MTKHEVVAQSLLGDIHKKAIEPGDKLPSEKELCSRFGVSRNVVRQALRNLEQMGYTETRRGIGSFCIQPRKNEQSSSTIGFIGFFSHSYIFPQIISGADSVLFHSGYYLLLGQSLYNIERERKVLERYLESNVAGIIMEPIYDGNLEYSNYHLIKEIIDRNIPVVFIDNYLPGLPTTNITLDDQKAGYEAARYLWERGHRRIGLFYQSDYITKVKRMKGAESFLKEKNEAAVHIPFSGQGEQSTAFVTARDYLSENRGEVSAVFCSSDEDAMHFVEAAEETGIQVPEDISIIGFDNWKASAFARIGLTTFEHPSVSIGETAARSLLELCGKKSRATEVFITMTPRMIERKSVRKLV